jgi:N4-gp56 family major capsid protein
MANTVVRDTANEVEQWRATFLEEFTREMPFKAYMGMDDKGENAVIHVVEDLESAPGLTVNIPLVMRLTEDGTTGDGTLEGNEEALDIYNCDISCEQLRHAVARGKTQQFATSIDLLKAGKGRLKGWHSEKLRDQIVDRMKCHALDGVTEYADATETQKDAWSAANADRIVAGAVVSNYNADHSTMLATIDNTSDKLTTSLISLAKRKAKLADPRIRPVKVKGGKEYFVLFVGPLPFRDLKESTAMQTANRDGRERGVDNPIFEDGDLLWDGVVIKEIPEMGVISGVGAGGIDVGIGLLCGAQALGLAWKDQMFVAEDTRDYGNVKGVAVGDTRGVKKMIYNSKQHGCVTIITAAVADA